MSCLQYYYFTRLTGSYKVVEGTRYGGRGQFTAMVERISAEDAALQRGLMVANSLSTVKNGRISVQVANFSQQDIYLPARARIGQLGEAEPIAVEESFTMPQVSKNEVRIEEHYNTDEVSNRLSSPDVTMSKLDLGDNFSEEQIPRLKSLISRYDKVLSKGDHDLGYCDIIKHKISTVDGIPVKLPHRRIPPHQWKGVKEYIDTNLNNSVICPSISPYASAKVIAQKSCGKIRVCLDFRALNAKTIKDAYPLPRIEESLESLNGAKYFSSIDLAHGFLQCALDEADMHKTAFRAGAGGLYEYTRLPMGLCNAPATFSRLMQACLEDQNMKILVVYLDDILVLGKTFNEMMDRLELVFSRLQKFALKIKPEKCHLFQEEVNYLGHVVSSSGISTDQKKSVSCCRMAST